MLAPEKRRACTVRQHALAPATAKSKALDRVKLSIQHGPLGSFDHADGELLAALWNAYHNGTPLEKEDE